MSCDLRSEDDQYAAEVEMAFGTDATAEAMTNNIMQAVAIDHAQTKTYTSALFNVTTTGLYRLGIHACGKSSIYYLYADRLRIEKKEQSGIDAQLPKDVQVTSDNGTAYITNPEQRLVRIYDLNGRHPAARKQPVFVQHPHSARHLPAAIRRTRAEILSLT